MPKVPPLITARGLSRTFDTKDGPVHAVRTVDFEVAAGEIVGVLGPNGAGKTTTMRMLTTLLRPTGGEAVVAGHDLLRDPVNVRRSIGYVAQSDSALAEAIVGEELVLQARLFGVSKATAAHRAEALLTTLDLPDVGRRAYGSLSGGQRRRVDIVGGLIHQPRLIFLDEPTSGLDPQSRANLWDHLRKLRADGTTIVLTTHYLDEADALCDRVLILDYGAVIAAGTPAELKARIAGDVISVDVNGDPAEAARIAGEVATVRQTLVDGARVNLTVQRGDEAVVPILRNLDAAGVALQAITVKRPSLDDVFLALTGRTLREADESNAAPAGPVDRERALR
jgi:ABC-2 type transport system ATP-binding protein